MDLRRLNRLLFSHRRLDVPFFLGPTDVEATSVSDSQEIIAVELNPKSGIDYGPEEPTQPNIGLADFKDPKAPR